MEQEFSKNLIYGNFRSMPNEAFPIDCETLSALQNNTQKIAAIAKLAGGNLILSGCKPNGTRRTEGYVYVDNGLTGEILYHPDQLRDDIYCHIDDKTTETVRADGIDFVDAYTIRYLKEGAAGTPIRWETFLDLSKVSNAALKNALTALQQSLQSEITARQNAVTAEKTARENADASTLASAKSYTDSKVSSEASTRQTGDNNTLASAKAYTDSKVSSEASTRQTGDNNTLANAKAYTDTKVSTETSARQTGDSNTLADAKVYTDSVFGAMNVETDNYGAYVHAFKQGRIVYLDIHGLPLSNRKDGKHKIHISLFSRFYPKNGYNGVGFHTNGNLSGIDNGNNLLPFSISEYGELVVVNPGNVSAIWASACYLSKE